MKQQVHVGPSLCMRSAPYRLHGVVDNPSRPRSAACPKTSCGIAGHALGS
jgi:hypothetical protein